MPLIKREQSSAERPELFGRPVAGWPDWLHPWWEPLKSAMIGTWIPVEEYEDEGTLVVRAEIPGIDPDRDVEITIDAGQLQIRAERRQESSVEESRYARSEIRYGHFARSLPLPPGCSEEDVSASYKDGILTVRLPAAPEAARRVPVLRG
jgi:HSP20 family protein